MTQNTTKAIQLNPAGPEPAMPSRIRRLLPLTAIFLLTGCSTPQSAAPVQPSNSAPAAAQQPQTPSLPAASKPEPVRSGFQRGKLLNRLQQAQAERAQRAQQAQASGGGSAPQQDEWLARYGHDRLYKASSIRSWAVVPVIPVGIDAFMKTAWAKGNLHIRLAMLGPVQNLQLFMRDHNQLRITFTDQGGTNLKEMLIPCSSMEQAPPSANGGAPTYQFESDIETPLEVYEQFYQWQFEWE